MEQASPSTDEPPLYTEQDNSANPPELQGPLIELTADEIRLLLELSEIAAIKDHHQKKEQRDKLLSVQDPSRMLHAVFHNAQEIRRKLNGSLECNVPLRKLVDGIRMQAKIEIQSRQTNFA